MTIWTKDYLIALLERVIATFLMTFLAVSGLDATAVGETGLDGIKWKAALAAAGVAALLSAVKGILANLVTKNGPSLTSSEQVFPPEPQPTGNPGPSVDEPDAVG
jgi:hypothetical protein